MNSGEESAQTRRDESVAEQQPTRRYPPPPRPVDFCLATTAKAREQEKLHNSSSSVYRSATFLTSYTHKRSCELHAFRERKKGRQRPGGASETALASEKLQPSRGKGEKPGAKGRCVCNNEIIFIAIALFALLQI
jgi:hypothetical protein